MEGDSPTRAVGVAVVEALFSVAKGPKIAVTTSLGGILYLEAWISLPRCMI